MDQMFIEARVNNLWFYCHYQELWFSPDELQAAQLSGRFKWGAVNWQLRSPLVRLAQLENRARMAAIEVEDFRKRMK